MAKVPISGEAVATFVGHGGSAIRKLRRLCVGCSVDLSPVGAGGVAQVSLMAEDEPKLGAALGLVEKWVRQQQVCCVLSGPRCLLRVCAARVVDGTNCLSVCLSVYRGVLFLRLRWGGKEKAEEAVAPCVRHRRQEKRTESGEELDEVAACVLRICFVLFFVLFVFGRGEGGGGGGTRVSCASGCIVEV